MAAWAAPPRLWRPAGLGYHAFDLAATRTHIALVLALVAVLAASVAGCRGEEPAPVATAVVAVAETPVPAALPTVAAPTETPTSPAAPPATAAPPVPTETATPTPAYTKPAPAADPASPGPAVMIGGAVFPVELAVTDAERRQGLSDRPSLAPGAGMLFVFESDGPRRFWMKNMHFPLDMVWIGSDCAVGEISGGVPPPPPGADDADVARVSPGQEAQYVLEINGGEAAALGLEAGDPVVFAGAIAGQYGC